MKFAGGNRALPVLSVIDNGVLRGYVPIHKDWTGFPEGHVYEDMATTFQIISRYNKICVLNTPLYRYRKRPGSILETHSFRNVKDWLMSCSCFESFVEKNIPDIFSEEQLKRLWQWRINGMVSRYVKLYNKDIECCKFLRRRIIEESKAYGIGDYGIRRRIFYWIVRFFPRFLYLICPFYNVLRRCYLAIKFRL